MCLWAPARFLPVCLLTPLYSKTTIKTRLQVIQHYSLRRIRDTSRTQGVSRCVFGTLARRFLPVWCLLILFYSTKKKFINHLNTTASEGKKTCFEVYKMLTDRNSFLIYLCGYRAVRPSSHNRHLTVPRLRFTALLIPRSNSHFCVHIDFFPMVLE